MSIDSVGPATALARIAAIQSRFTVVAPASSTSVSSTAATSAASTSLAATGSTAPSFESILGSAIDQAKSMQAQGISTTVSASGDVGARAVEAGKKYLGVPYLWGGTDPAKGLDCSGLVQRAYADVGVTLPRVADDQARMGAAVTDLAHARPGDLLAFGSPVDHIGIYVGDHKMLVAPRAGQDVKIQDVYRTPSAIRRIAGPADQSVATSAAARVATPGVSTPGVSTAGVASDVPAQFRGLFASAAQRYDVPVALLTSVAKAESGFNPGAVSHAGAVGLMQLMPATARGLGVDPRNPAQAIDGAARLLASHLDKFGSTSLALAAYNAGPGAVQRYGGVPPYRETQQYVQRVIGYMGGAA
ncbi:MAG: transglycosylase SLT domain-containing protein [Pedococcus sp.]